MAATIKTLEDLRNKLEPNDDENQGPKNNIVIFKRVKKACGQVPFLLHATSINSLVFQMVLGRVRSIKGGFNELAWRGNGVKPNWEDIEASREDRLNNLGKPGEDYSPEREAGGGFPDALVCCSAHRHVSENGESWADYINGNLSDSNTLDETGYAYKDKLKTDILEKALEEEGVNKVDALLEKIGKVDTKDLRYVTTALILTEDRFLGQVDKALPYGSSVPEHMRCQEDSDTKQELISQNNSTQPAPKISYNDNQHSQFWVYKYDPKNMPPCFYVCYSQQEYNKLNDLRSEVNKVVDQHLKKESDKLLIAGYETQDEVKLLIDEINDIANRYNFSKKGVRVSCEEGSVITSKIGDYLRSTEYSIEEKTLLLKKIKDDLLGSTPDHTGFENFKIKMHLSSALCVSPEDHNDELVKLQAFLREFTLQSGFSSDHSKMNQYLKFCNEFISDAQSIYNLNGLFPDDRKNMLLSRAEKHACKYFKHKDIGAKLLLGLAKVILSPLSFIAVLARYKDTGRVGNHLKTWCLPWRFGDTQRAKDIKSFIKQGSGLN